jgi:membrane-associated protease RseP (regulator of RpoE activity)
MFSLRQRRGFRLRTVAIILAIGGGMSETSAFAQGGGGLFGGLFRGRANTGGTGGLGYYPYYGAASGYYANPGYNIYGNYGVYGYPGSRIEGGYGNAGYDPGYGGYPSYGGYGITNPGRTAAPAVGSPLVQRRLLGIDEEPVVVAGGVKAMKVGKVYPGTAAERAGLKAGDVIRSVNGYLTEQRGNLAWVIANAAPDNQLKISVQAETDGQTRLITATIP